MKNENKETNEQEESNGVLMIKALLGFAAVGYAIYILTQ